MDILATSTNRKLIETLLQEVSGKDWTLKLTVRENLPSSGGESRSGNYTDDPLIREALEMFKGQIRS
jgi:transposase-like protein